MAIQKVVKNSVSQQVFDQLQEQILAGTWRPGQKIPSENELAAQFGVSRVTVRNALQKLSGLGLLETRVGEGSFVRAVGPDTAMDQLLPMLYLRDDSLRDVLRFRRIVEGPICEVACRRATERDIEELRGILHRMERAQNDTHAFAEQDSAFHLALARITQSQMLLRIYQILDEAMQAAFQHSTHYRANQIDLHYCKLVVKAFEEHDSAAAGRWIQRAVHETYTISTVYQNVVNMEAVYGERVAIRYVDDATLTVRQVRYREYVQDIRRCVRHLQRTIPDLRGCPIALLARNSYHYAVHLFAILLAGAVAVPLNIEKSWPEIQYELQKAAVRCVVTDGAYLQREPGFAACSCQQLGMEDYTACREQAQLTECEDREALALVLFTTGAGRSKGVMLSQKNLFAPMRIFVDPFEDTRRALGYPANYQFSSFNVLPMFHVAALASLFSWSMAGCAINLCNNVRNFYRDMRMMESDVMSVVPVLLNSIHRDVLRGKRGYLGKLRLFTCSAATYDTAILSDMIANGFYIIQMYGLTETVGDGAWNAMQDPAHLASVGKRDPDMEYKLDRGELCMKGDAVMMGYINDPEATAAVLRDGWFYTGDLARMDEDGFIYLLGRKNNLMVLANGENVSPEELEALLAPNRDILDVLVREKNGRICAAIYCRPSRRAAVQKAVAELNRSLPLYKRITELEFTAAAHPRDAGGKVIRR